MISNRQPPANPPPRAALSMPVYGDVSERVVVGIVVGGMIELSHFIVHLIVTDLAA